MGSPARPEDKVVADGFAGLRNALKKVAADRGEWAGIPLPIDGQPLVIEPTYPHAATLAMLGRDPPTNIHGDTFVNSWITARPRVRVVVGRDSNGQALHGLLPATNGGMQLSTIGASDAWGLEQEIEALELLRSLVNERQFKQYFLTGMFLEKSKRSGVHYIFRKLRPTIAMRETKDNEDMRTLCTLCLHPIAYYQDSWAGAMAPTDDVVSHLMLMRGDEVMFWRRSNQHSAKHPQSGLH